jgi:hypothetical protein
MKNMLGVTESNYSCVKQSESALNKCVLFAYLLKTTTTIQTYLIFCVALLFYVNHPKILNNLIGHITICCCHPPLPKPSFSSNTITNN